MSLNVDTLFSYSSSLAGGRSYTGNHIHLPFYLKRKRGSRAMLYSTTFSHPSSVGMGLASILFPIAEAMSRMDARPIPTQKCANTQRDGPAPLPDHLFPRAKRMEGGFRMRQSHSASQDLWGRRSQTRLCKGSAFCNYRCCHWSRRSRTNYGCTGRSH